MQKKIVSFLFILSLLAIASCAKQKSLDEMNDVELFNHAEVLYKDKNYEDAIDAYEKLKNNFPKSDLAIEAETKICHAYFDDEKYLESAECYKDFKDLHPSYKNSEFMYYRLGLSYYLDNPKSIDRDQTNLGNAIASFSEFERLFPESKDLSDVQEKMRDARTRLAKKELLIAHFYFNRKEFKAAMYRYQQILADYPGMDLNEEAMYKLGYTYYRLGKPKKAHSVFTQFLQKYPVSKFLKDVEAMLANL
jgi:outer membrane protein assembly factor BamD